MGHPWTGSRASETQGWPPAHVSCDQSKQVVEIDLADFKVTKMFNAGAGADGLAWAKRP